MWFGCWKGKVIFGCDGGSGVLKLREVYGLLYCLLLGFCLVLVFFLIYRMFLIFGRLSVKDGKGNRIILSGDKWKVLGWRIWFFFLEKDLEVEIKIFWKI